MNAVIPFDRMPRQRRFGFALIVALACLLHANALAAASADAIRIKDLGKVQGWRDNALVGYGLVSGLAGTGDSPSNRTTRQALANVITRFEQVVTAEQVQSRNVAVVMVTAALPSTAREGDSIDVTVTSVGDARSLVGGSLLLTPMSAPNGKVHALAQGALSVGGYRYDANGNVVQKNHPTVGSIPAGAFVEVGAHSRSAEGPMTFVLSEPDYTTAARVASAINREFGDDIAEARDASGIELRVPEGLKRRLVSFVARIEGVWVEPDRRAKVVLNERTGIVVAGGDVRIAKVAVSHGDLRVSVVSETSASQPLVLGIAGPSVATALITNSRVEVSEPTAPAFVSGGNTVADLVQALTRMRTSTRDIISILKAVKAAGALHAELIVQ